MKGTAPELEGGVVANLEIVAGIRGSDHAWSEQELHVHVLAGIQMKSRAMTLFGILETYM